MKTITTWLLALLLITGLILCAQDLTLFPWAHLAGLACIAALGWIANKHLDLENDEKGVKS